MNAKAWFYSQGFHSHQQAALFAVPAPAPVCHNCKQPRSKVMRDRQEIMNLRPDRYQSMLEAYAVICCNPDSEYRCPDCDSEKLTFAAYDNGAEADTGYQDAGERYICLDCGARGDAQDCEPPAQPWAELEAVRKAREDVEDDTERARRERRGSPAFAEVA